MNNQTNSNELMHTIKRHYGDIDISAQTMMKFSQYTFISFFYCVTRMESLQLAHYYISNIENLDSSIRTHIVILERKKKKENKQNHNKNEKGNQSDCQTSTVKKSLIRVALEDRYDKKFPRQCKPNYALTDSGKTSETTMEKSTRTKSLVIFALLNLSTNSKKGVVQREQ